MTTIDRRVLASHVRAANLRSGLAARLESGPGTRLDFDGLAAEVKDLRALGLRFSSAEEAALHRVYRVLGAPALFDLTELVDDLRHSTHAKLPERKRRPLDPSVPFGGVGAPRVSSQPSSTGERAWNVSVGSSVNAHLVMSPDDRYVLTRNTQGHLLVLDRASGDVHWDERIGNMGHATPALHPDGRRAFVLSSEGAGKLYAVDYTERELLWELDLPGTPQNNGPTSSPVLSPDGGTLFVVSRTGALVACAVDERRVLWEQPLGAYYPNTYASPKVSPDGRTVVFGGASGELHAFDTETGEERWRVKPPKLLNATPVFSPDGRRVLCASSGLLQALDVENDGAELWRAEMGELKGVTSPLLTHGGENVLIGCGDGSLYLFDVESGEKRREIPVDPGQWLSQTPVLDAEQRVAFVASMGGRMFRVDLDTGEVERVSEDAVANTWGGFLVSPDGKWAYQGGTHTTELKAFPLEP